MHHRSHGAIPEGALSFGDFVILWGIPVACVALLIVGAATGVWWKARFRPRSRIHADVVRKVEAKRSLRSGQRAAVSLPYVLGLLVLDAGVQATLLYRLSNQLAGRRMRGLAAIVHAIAKFLTQIDISPQARIEGGLAFNHGSGVVIGKLTKIGKGVTICQGVTTGGGGRPEIEAGAYIGAGAKLIGDVRIGADAVVGANAVVIDDVPDGATAVGVPARTIKQGAKARAVAGQASTAD